VWRSSATYGVATLADSRCSGSSRLARESIYLYRTPSPAIILMYIAPRLGADSVWTNSDSRALRRANVRVHRGAHSVSRRTAGTRG